jgi:hypothetical protein
VTSRSTESFTPDRKVKERLSTWSGLDCPGRLALTFQLITGNTSMSDHISIPDSVTSNKLQAMQFVAKMKEAADRNGVGFIGGFIADDGEKFIMTNMNEEDSQALLPDHLK